MMKGTRPRISMMVLALLIGLIFFAGKPRHSSAQNDGFASYQLLVFCSNSSVASATFWHNATEGGTVGRPRMGLKTVCAGKKCSGGPVTLANALAQLPANVSSVMEGKVNTYQEKLGNEADGFLACLGNDKEKAPDAKCDTEKACEKIAAVHKLIDAYEGVLGVLPGSFAEFNGKLSKLLLELSEALACRFNKDHDAADAAVLNDFLGQVLRDRNGFQTLTSQAKVPQAISCNTDLARSGSAECTDYEAIQRIKENLSRLASALGCPGSPAKPPTRARNICKPGEKKVEPGDEEAKNQLVGGVQAAIDELKSTAESIEGQGGAAAQRIEGIKKRIATYEKIKGFWENIKAGSCVPADVYQTILQVANDHRSNGYSENCPALCKAATEWFGRMNPGPQTGIQKKFFMETCMAYCS